MRQSRYIGESWDTYTFLRGERADYCVYGEGFITRTWHKSMIEERVSMYLNKGKLKVKCAGKNFVVKHLMAQAFIAEYRKGDSVVCVDGDECNVALNNLKVYTKKELGKKTGHMARSEPVKVTDLTSGETAVYGSIRKAAKALYCSYQTVIDALNGKYKRSVLEKFKIERSEL